MDNKHNLSHDTDLKDTTPLLVNNKDERDKSVVIKNVNSKLMKFKENNISQAQIVELRRLAIENKVEILERNLTRSRDKVMPLLEQDIKDYGSRIFEAHDVMATLLDMSSIYILLSFILVSIITLLISIKYDSWCDASYSWIIVCLAFYINLEENKFTSIIIGLLFSLNILRLIINQNSFDWVMIHYFGGLLTCFLYLLMHYMKEGKIVKISPLFYGIFIEALLSTANSAWLNGSIDSYFDVNLKIHVVYVLFWKQKTHALLAFFDLWVLLYILFSALDSGISNIGCNYKLENCSNSYEASIIVIKSFELFTLIIMHLDYFNWLEIDPTDVWSRLHLLKRALKLDENLIVE